MQFLETIVDPAVSALRNAPLDHEPWTEDEKAGVTETRTWLRNNAAKGIPHAEAMRRRLLTWPISTKASLATSKQAEASRLNGAKSRGPVTAEGKAISRRNGIKHGFLSHLLLDGENPEQLDDIYRRLEAEHQPVTETDYDMLEKTGAALWRETRLQDVETECINAEIRNQIRLNPQLAQSKPRERAAKGWKACAENSRIIQLVNTCELRLDRRYMRCVEYIKNRRKERDEAAQNDASTEPGEDLLPCIQHSRSSSRRSLPRPF